MFTTPIGLKNTKNVADNLTCDGDKTRQYKDDWVEQGIPFPIGTMIYLLGKEPEFVNQLCQTSTAWVYPSDWMVIVYHANVNDPLYGPVKIGIKQVIEQLGKLDFLKDFL